MKIFFVLCVIFLSESLVFNQDINETSIDIHKSVEQKRDQDSCLNSYEAIVNYTNDQKYVESVGKAISDVINELFIKQNIPFDILMFDYKENGTIEVIGKVGKILSDNYATTIKKIELKDDEKTKIDQSALILVDGENIETFNTKVYLANMFPKKLKFLVYTYKSGDLFDAPKFLTSYGDISQYEYFLADKNNEELELTTFEWFTDTECNLKTYKHLNTFNRNSQKWEKKLENHEKFKNLHNCMIHVHTFHGTYEKKFNPRKQSSTYDILDIVAERRNFTILQGEITANIDTKVQGEEQKVHLDHNLVLDGHYLSEYNVYHFTTTYLETSVIFMITPGELYTSYEKILLPFDELTWYFLIATFGVAFGVIFVVNLMPKHIQDYFYGDGVSVPAFNVVGTFFGIGQLRLPNANFPRMIVMIFILFCLIIRTAYQGVMFEMMTKEMRKSSPQTIDDLFEWNFSVNLLTVYSGFIPISRLFYENIDENRQNAVKFLDVYDFHYNFCTTIINPEEKFAVNTDFNEYNRMTQLCKKAPKLLNEQFITIPVGLAMSKNNFLYEAIEEVMQLTIPTGIPQYWRQYHQWYQFDRNHYTEIIETGAQILRLEDLSFGFIIWLIACGVAVLGLLCELIVFAINKLKRLTRVEPIEINNTNILLPKKPVKIKVKKSKIQKKLSQQNSTLDVQSCKENQAEIINEAEVELNPSEINQNNAKNLQQAKMNQQQTVLKMEDDIDEEFESGNSTKLETTKISIEDERTGSRRSLKSSCNVAHQGLVDFDNKVDIEDKFESRLSSKLEISRVSTENAKTLNSKSFDRFKQFEVASSGNNEDLKVIDLENDAEDNFESGISSTELSSKENLNKTVESTKINKIKSCNAFDAENFHKSLDLNQSSMWK